MLTIPSRIAVIIAAPIDPALLTPGCAVYVQRIGVPGYHRIGSIAPADPPESERSEIDDPDAEELTAAKIHRLALGIRSDLEGLAQLGAPAAVSARERAATITALAVEIEEEADTDAEPEGSTIDPTAPGDLVSQWAVGREGYVIAEIVRRIGEAEQGQRALAEAFGPTSSGESIMTRLAALEGRMAGLGSLVVAEGASPQPGDVWEDTGDSEQVRVLRQTSDQRGSDRWEVEIVRSVGYRSAGFITEREIVSPKWRLVSRG